MNTNTKRSILITGIITFVSVILLFLVTYFVMLFAFPRQLGDFYLNLGCNNMASALYHKVYKDDDNIYYCYKALQLKVNENDYINIVNYYEDFIEDDEFNMFVLELSEHNENLNAGILEKSLFLDEINFIHGSYVNALVKLGDVEKAFNYAIDLLKNNNTLSLQNIGYYNFSHFINDDFEYNSFLTKLIGEDSLLTKIQDYFIDCVEVFNNNSIFNDNLSKSYLMLVGNRIVSVGQDLNVIYNKLSIKTDLVTSNVKFMEDINGKIMELIR